MTETSTSEINNTDSFDSPGELLRAKREEKKLSTEEIAKRVHLDVKIIEAIEGDDYSNMPTATYVRGYLRSYAKTVNADADKVIQLYNADSPPPPPDILPEVKPPTQVSSSDKPVKAVTYLVSLALVLLLLIWYQSNFVVETNESSQQAPARPDRINNTDTTYKIVIHPEGWQTPIYEEETESANEPDNSEIKNETMSQKDVTPPAETSEDNGEASLGILPINEMNEVNTPVSTGPDSIVLTLTKDSWIEIYDKDNERLFMDLGKAGEHHIINGTAPFNITLGYAEGVNVQFNGKFFDTSPYTKNGIARFTLPPQ